MSLGGSARARQFKIFLKLDEGLARLRQVWRWYQTGGAVYMLEGTATLWRDLGRLEKWSTVSLEYSLSKHWEQIVYPTSGPNPSGLLCC